MSRSLLVEIGTEELPASYLAPYSAQVLKLFEAAFSRHNLAAEAFRVAYTPRRLAFFCQAIPEQQPTSKQEVKGPPVSVAFKNGQPTKAAEAFAAKAGVPIEQLERTLVNDKEYLFATISQGGAPTSTLLPDIIATVIRSLKAPKSMRWEDKPTVFARPVRWLVALFGADQVPVMLDGLSAGRVTYGHRFLSPDPIQLARADWQAYADALYSAHVILDARDRENEIVRQLIAHGAREEKLDRQLVATCANLVEWPNVIRGAFSSEYLTLPEPVLVTSLKKHQKSFPVYDDQGAVAAGFLSVANNDLKDAERIRSGYERVIVARLADAKFFWDEDLRKPLADKIEALKLIVFQQELGSYYAKAERVQTLIGLLSTLSGREQACPPAQRAALLARTDLLTAMVFEFPELQGIMGSIYVRVIDHEPAEIADAIREMYLPRTADDALPATDAGRLLSITDKIDTIAGCCAIGLGPTGSADPYALRRQSLGVLRTITARNLRFSLSTLIDAALDLFPGDSPDSVRTQILQLFSGRFETVLKDAGIRYDIINAIMASGWDITAVAFDKARQLMAMLDTDAFRKACTVVERCHNITRDVCLPDTAVDPALFTVQLEHEAWDIWCSVSTRLTELTDADDYRAALTLVADRLYDTLHTYFDQVRVNVEDESIRVNRHKMLRVIRNTLSSGIADLSQIVFENSSH